MCDQERENTLMLFRLKDKTVYSPFNALVKMFKRFYYSFKKINVCLMILLLIAD